MNIQDHQRYGIWPQQPAPPRPGHGLAVGLAIAGGVILAAGLLLPLYPVGGGMTLASAEQVCSSWLGALGGPACGRVSVVWGAHVAALWGGAGMLAGAGLAWLRAR